MTSNIRTSNSDWKSLEVGDVIDYNDDICIIIEKKPGGVIADVIIDRGGYGLKTQAITYAWLKHNLKKIYTKEENPEYYL